jgi:hypothetical protein
VSLGIGDVEPAADHADRRRPTVGARVERASVRGAVDAEREPGHHAHAGTRQVAPELEREVVSVTRAPARADDRRTRSVERIEVAAVEQHARRVGVVGECSGVAGVSEQVDTDAVRRVRRPVVGDIGGTRDPAPLARHERGPGPARRLDPLVPHRLPLDHTRPRLVGRPRVEQRREPAGPHARKGGERGAERLERKPIAAHALRHGSDGRAPEGEVPVREGP